MDESLGRYLNTQWVIEWLRHPDQKTCLEEIRFVHAMLPYNRQMAIRMTVLQYIGVLGLPEGGRLAFVVRAIENLIAQIDWNQVEAEVFRPDIPVGVTGS